MPSSASVWSTLDGVRAERLSLDKKGKGASLDLSDVFAPKFHSAELVFAGAMIVLTLFLATQYDAQTRIVEGRALIAQPGFWSWLSVFGMLIFGLPYGVTVLKKHREIRSPEPAIVEVKSWIMSAEFAIWFLCYVMMVPNLGYILSTLIFTLIMTYRTGYRDKKYFIGSVIFSFGTVIIFKSILGVSIPGGDIYDVFPAQIRNFLIMNF